ncbi:MAG: Gx transporter family protein [Lachnospiraceae bacterium]|nr:Gx transporter family protein [Lachnospiraceae bacterium]
MGKKVATCAVLVALAMIFSYIEAILPIPFGVPGVKLGLANLVVVTGFYILRPGEVFLVSAVRILLSSLLFGNALSLLYSLAGGILSFFVMLGLKHVKGFSVAGVSLAGGVAHNIGQIAVAAWVVKNTAVLYYLPALTAAGVAAGLLMGILASRVLAVLRR